MMYASVQDVQDRLLRDLSDRERELCGNLLEDAAAIIDAYNRRAEPDMKKSVSISMVRRILAMTDDIPVGATQGSMSALGYSQSFTFGGGGSGEMYLSKVDKKMLGVSARIGSHSPLEDIND